MEKTPLLVDVTVKNFTTYIQSLTRRARKNYYYVRKKNWGVTYERILYDRELVHRYMSLWEHQKIRGRFVTWAFQEPYLDELERQKKLYVFVAKERGEIIALHFVENHDGYVECHPPLYDKEGYLFRSIAKFMWFKLIKWAIQSKEMRWLDLGGGGRGTWREFIMARNEHENPRYKWIYVPKDVKAHPELQPNYIVKWENNCKYLYDRDFGRVC